MFNQPTQDCPESYLANQVYRRYAAIPLKQAFFKFSVFQLLLFQLNDRGRNDTIASLKGDVTIYYAPTFCMGDPTRVCSSSMQVIYQRSGDKLTVEVDDHFDVRFNDEPLNNLDLQPLVNDVIYVKKVTSLFVVIAGFGFSVLFNHHGQVYVTLDPFFMNRVRADAVYVCDFSINSAKVLPSCKIKIKMS